MDLRGKRIEEGYTNLVTVEGDTVASSGKLQNGQGTDLGNVAVGGLSFNSGDSELQLPAGTTAERPSSPSAGYARFNTDKGKVEIFTGGAWLSIALEGAVQLEAATATVTGQDAVAQLSSFIGQFGTPASAFSVRQLGETDVCMRVRRSSDNAEQNIGFTSDGDLDETALTTFVGANDGFVTTWYDQSVDNSTLPAEHGSGATASYSLRLVDSTYTGDAIRVRRSSDNAEQDIGFDANGELDTTSLETFVGTDVNLVPHSEQFDQWDIISANNGTQITANTDVAPDGSTTADTVTDNETNTFTGVGKNFNVNTAGVHTVGVYVKKKASSPNDMMFRVTRSGLEHNIIFDAETGTAVDREGNIDTIGVTSVDSNWWLLEMTISLTAVQHQIQIYPTIATTSNTNFVMSMTGSVVLWGCHAYPGVSGTYSYVETGANPVGDAFVTTWYDQSGSNDATQATAGSQPQIVSSGSTITENGKPALDFDGSDDFLINTALKLNPVPISLFMTFKPESVKLAHILDQSQGSTAGIIYRTNALDFFEYYYYPDATAVELDSPISLTQQLHSFVLENGTQTLHIDGDNVFNGTLSITNNPVPTNDFIIGKDPDNSGREYDGTIQELIYYDTDQSSNRESIELNQASYYDIGVSIGATQSTAGSQPKIVSSGTVIKENSVPALDFAGNDIVMRNDSLASLFHGNTTYTLFVVTKNTSTSNGQLLQMAVNDGNPQNQFVRYLSNQYFIQHEGGSVSFGTPTTNQVLLSQLRENNIIDMFADGSQILTNESVTQNGTSYNTFTFGAAFNSGGYVDEWSGIGQEVIIYTSDKSADRTSIESNIATYYNITI